jgi:anaphase-promoting complex subunit 1
MAHVQSLGIHEPSALQYLIDEGVLPNQSSHHPYSWQIHPVYDDAGEEVTEDELLQTKHCVVWARGGIVKRAFNLEVEDEEILQSFITRFPAEKKGNPPKTGTAGLSGVDNDRSIQANDKFSSSPTSKEQPAGQALVVILKTKAHIYFLNGNSHIVSLPFEVEKAFPTARGCLLQRKGSRSLVGQAALTAPQNSFVSSQLSSSQTRPQQVTLKIASSSRPSLTLSPVARSNTVPLGPQNRQTPSVFLLTDPQAVLGVAVRRVLPFAARRSTDDSEQPFDPAEQLLYISQENEIASSVAPELELLHLAVTRNAESGTFTVWKVEYRDRDSHDSSPKRRKVSQEGQTSRRRSSNLLRATGSTTPIGNALGESRESLSNQNGRSFQETHSSLRHDEHKSTEIEDLATELGSDFADVGVQTRAARRVSSMLARTDLSMGPDRAPINGFASSNAGRKSLSRGGARGESIGDIRDRQSFGARPSSSFAGIGSFRSTDTSFLGAPLDRPLEGLGSGGEFNGFDNVDPEDVMSELPADLIFSKVHTFPSSTSIPVNQAPDSQIKVFVLATRPSGRNGVATVASLSIGIMDKEKGELSVIRVEVMLSRSATSKGKQYKERPLKQKRSLDLAKVNVQRGANIIDACKIRDGSHCCILVLTRTRDGQTTLVLEALGISSIMIDLPTPLVMHDPFCIPSASRQDRKQEEGRSRTLKGSLRNINALENTSIRGRADLVDQKAQRHRLQIQLEPRHPYVKKILETVEFTLSDKGGQGIFVAWIEVMRWLRLKGSIERSEWSAVVIVLFSMIVPFIPEQQARAKITPRRSKAGLLRSSSGVAIDMSCWDEMVGEESTVGATSPDWCTSPAWEWIGRVSDIWKSPVREQSVPRSSSTETPQPPFEGKRISLLSDCVLWTRELLKSPIGDHLSGKEGVLPTASNRDRETRRASVASVLVALHLLREEQKLDIRSSGLADYDVQLAPVLAQIGQWLNWPDWGPKEGCYYHAEISNMEKQLFDDNVITSFDLPSQLFAPVSIFEFVEASFSDSRTRPFVTLLDIVSRRDPDTAGILASRAKALTPRTSALLKYFSGASSCRTWSARIEWMNNCGLNLEILATLPTGISAYFYDIVSSCEGSPPSSWPEPLLRFVGRDDLNTRQSHSTSQATTTKPHNLISHEATRDHHGIGTSILDTEPSHSWDTSSEADRQAVTRLIFRDDRRFQDASRLVNQLRPPVAECHPEPDWTEADLLDAQKELVQLVTMRTLTVASGRGMMNYSSRVPLLTEKVPVPAFTLACQVRPSNVTFSADRASFTEDRAVWAFFHNGTSAGLTISKEARGIDTSWILYNKPLELTNRHAGFLLALGLNGHLKSLAKWVAFKYLTPKHTMTSIGLLLGLSASYLGTMDTLITRLLSVHVTRMLPPGAAELNLSPLTQTTGIMGIGLLYCSSQHRRMSEVMLSEIENNDVEEGVPPEQTLRDEGYRLAAGFALGFINLGQGKRLHGLHDMNVMERLLSIAIGTKNVNLVHILDRATSGATIAFALIYMKTDDESIAHKIDIPDTLHQFDYVRPDIFLLRTAARHLIMWSSIQPTYDFFQASLPKPYRQRASLFSTRHLNSEDMPFFNILAGLCLALGLRFAGSSSHLVRDLLTSYLDQFIRLTRLPALNYDAKLTRNAVRNCQDVTALSLTAVMAGTGDLVVFRRLRSLHGRVDPDTPYGSHLAAHMAIGILFLGGGTYTLGTSDIAVASLLCAFYPVFPTNVMDNQAHLQAFRHLWVLATEPRCVICRDVDTGRPVSAPIIVQLANSTAGEEEEKHLTAPCLLPSLDTITSIRTQAKGYWDVTISFNGPDAAKRKEALTKNHINIYLRRRAAYDAPQGSVFISEMQALAEQGVAPSVGLSSATPMPLAGRTNPLEWLWSLDTLAGLDVAEKALVLSPHSTAGSGAGAGAGGNAFLRGTVVDTRLELEHGVLPDERGRGGRMNRDELWSLRLLLGWGDGLSEEEDREGACEEGEGVQGISRRGNWLRKDVVERLRWRVWLLRMGVDDDEDEDE